jgi:hypothetical protein
MRGMHEGGYFTYMMTSKGRYEVGPADPKRGIYRMNA